MLRDRQRAGVDGALQVEREDRREVVRGEVLMVIVALTVLQCGRECFRNDKCDSYTGYIISGSNRLLSTGYLPRKLTRPSELFLGNQNTFLSCDFIIMTSIF